MCRSDHLLCETSPFFPHLEKREGHSVYLGGEGGLQVFPLEAAGKEHWPGWSHAQREDIVPGEQANSAPYLSSPPVGVQTVHNFNYVSSVESKLRCILGCEVELGLDTLHLLGLHEKENKVGRN